MKVRGHRVDLGEIESVLLTDPEVGSAVVALDPGGGGDAGSGDLAAYVVGEIADAEALTARLVAALRERLPAYMIPATLDVLDELPDAGQRQGRPRAAARTRRSPAGRRHRSRGGGGGRARGADRRRVGRGVRAGPRRPLGRGRLLRRARRPLPARATTVTLRERGVGGSPAVRDLYAHPSVRALATHLAGAGSATATSAAPRPGPVRSSTRRVAAAGTAQAVVLYLFLLAVTLPVSWVYTANDGTVSTEVLAQLLAAGAVAWLGVRWLLPVLLARPLAAGIRPGRYRLWGPTFLRLWTLDLVLRLAPLPVLVGSPLLAPYLRLLGARVGRRTHVATTDLTLPRMLHLDDDATVGYGAALHPWSVEDGQVVVGPVRLERRAVAGANTVLARQPDRLRSPRRRHGERRRPRRSPTAGGLPPRRRRAAGVRRERRVRVRRHRPGRRLSDRRADRAARPVASPAGTSWLGSPAMHLPRRQAQRRRSRGADVQARRDGGCASGSSIEFFRITLPASMMGVRLPRTCWPSPALAAAVTVLAPALAAPADRPGRVRGGGAASPRRSATSSAATDLGWNRCGAVSSGAPSSSPASTRPPPCPRCSACSSAPRSCRRCSAVRCPHRPAHLDRHDLSHRVRPRRDRRRRHGRPRGLAADPPVRGPGDEDVDGHHRRRRHRRRPRRSCCTTPSSARTRPRPAVAGDEGRAAAPSAPGGAAFRPEAA